jgi:hypothetical protein
MPIYGRHFEPGHLQFIATSTYRRVPVFSIRCFPQLFVDVLHGKKTAPEARLHAQQSGGAPARCFACGLAMVKLEVLLFGRRLAAGDGSIRVNHRGLLAQT